MRNSRNLSRGIFASFLWCITDAQICATDNPPLTPTTETKKDTSDTKTTDTKSEQVKKPLIYELSPSDKNEITRSILNAVKDAQITQKQREDLVFGAIELAQRGRKSGIDDFSNYIMPRGQKYYFTPLAQKLHAMFLTPLNPREYYDLSTQLDGFLTPYTKKDEKVEKTGFGVVGEDGLIHLNKLFSLVGPNIENLVELLQFKCKRGESGVCKWDEVHPVTRMESMVHSNLNGVTDELAVCGNSFYEKNCREWEYFAKHLRGCKFDHMRRCMQAAISDFDDIEEAKTAPKKLMTAKVLQDLLKDIWTYETGKENFLLPTSPDKTLDKTSDQTHKIITSPLGEHPEWDIRRFKTAEDFANNNEIQQNLLWIITLKELVRRDLYHGEIYKNDKNLEYLVKGEIYDVASRLARIKTLTDGNTIAIMRGLSSLSMHAGEALKYLIDDIEVIQKKMMEMKTPSEIDKVVEEENAQDQKFYGPISDADAIGGKKKALLRGNWTSNK